MMYILQQNYMTLVKCIKSQENVSYLFEILAFTIQNNNDIQKSTIY